MPTVLITGGTGLLGHRLATLLVEKGYTVNLLSRSASTPPKPYTNSFLWDVEAGTMDDAALTNCDYIVHLAGTPIADKPWTPARKKDIIDSRVKSTNLLFERLKSAPNTIKAFIAGTAVGYYGAVTQSKAFVETDPPGNDFMGGCCMLWENAVKQVETLAIRTVMVRTGIALSTQGGALEKIAGLAKFGPAAAVGTGKQAMPWIHIDDLCNIFILAIEDEQILGAYNATAPTTDTSTTFTKAVAKQIHRPMLPFPAPAFAIRLMYGELSVAVLEGTHASPQKIMDAGFRFEHTDLKEALKDLYDRGI